MKRFFRELRRREVVRTVGLYIGACWLLIEAASVLLPAFDTPDWVLRGLIIAAVMGLPVVSVLAWIYDVSQRGIARDTGPAGAGIPSARGRKMDFVVIGILAVALTFSVYLNLAGDPASIEEPDFVSVLIADFENDSGEPLFDGLLEQALAIGIESAPHIASLARGTAEDIASRLQPDAAGLPVEAARLVAVREGVDIVLSGAVSRIESGFRIELTASDPLSGESSFDVSSDAATRDDVLSAVGRLSATVRELLGDTTPRQTDAATAETFTAASIEAASTYMNAVELAFEGRHAEAVEDFRAATELDPAFGRAFAAWALSEFYLGRREEAESLWGEALSLMGTMTERERLRTLGVYYSLVTRNYEEAVESFSELVENYPADAAGRNNLAVAAFLTLDFQRAADEGRRILEIFPTSPLYRANAALYSMYSGDFDDAAMQAGEVIADLPEYGTSYLPLAVARLAAGDADGARDAYRAMAAATSGWLGESTAALGLADTEIYLGRFERAAELLREGVERDMARDAPSAAATKHIALAELAVQRGDQTGAVESAHDALGLSDQDSVKIAAAITLFNSADTTAAAQIAEELSARVQTQSRAYGAMLDAIRLRLAGEHVEAIDSLRAALNLTNLWRVRYELGLAYLAAGYPAEAFAEFDTCWERMGEATAMFLDDAPTFRYLSDLSFWTARAQESLGMDSAAMENFRVFLSLRPEGGPLADDARRRLP